MEISLAVCVGFMLFVVIHREHLFYNNSCVIFLESVIIFLLAIVLISNFFDGTKEKSHYEMIGSTQIVNHNPCVFSL